jgi:hypothetical protein
MKTFGLAILWVLSLSQAALATTLTQVQAWQNPECAQGPCALKSIRMVTYQDFDAGSAASRVATSFKTSDKAQLKDFAFVQYIRGCGYSIDANGVRKMAARTNIGVSGVPFQHKTWQLDTGSTIDPIYQSDQAGGDDPLRGIHLPRTGSYYLVNPFTHQNPAQWGGLESNVKKPKLFVADAPTGSSVDSSGNRSISSLEFRTCIYRVADVPESVDSADHVFPNALHCLEWKSNYAYDASTASFKPTTEIDPFCQVDPTN